MSKRENERQIFEAFLRVAPDFALERIVEWDQPSDEKEFPDVICRSESGRRLGVELGEWLNEGEIRSARGMERVQGSILEAIGEQDSNGTDNIFAIWLLLKARARIKPDDKAQFRTELFRCIGAVDRRWPTEKSWQSPQGHWARSDEFAAYPVLQRYLNGIQFFPSDWYEGWPPNGHKVKRRWPEGQDWILFPARGGPFSKDTMLQPLLELISDKIEHYGGYGTGFDHLTLVIYYNSALIYNAPVETPHFKFEDAAHEAKEFIGNDSGPFKDIFLFIGVNAGYVVKII